MRADWRRIRRRAAPAIVCGALALVPGTPVGEGRVAAADDRLVRTLALGDGQAVSVAVTVGTVRVTGDQSRADVRVDIDRRAPSPALLAAWRADVASTPDGVRIDVTQPDGARDPAWRTEVTLVVPSGARLDSIGIEEGRLHLSRLRGAVRATVARGTIEASDVAGAMRLETTLGDIVVAGARLSGDGPIRLRAFNGDVALRFAAPLADARVMALALNGAIHSSMPLTRKEGWGPRWAETSIGRADRVVSVDVVTGTITIDAP